MPCLGMCLGLQAMTIEFARNVMGLTGANSTEMDPTTPHPVIDLMHDQRDVTDKGGTMRLGAYYAILEPDTQGVRGLRRAGGQRAPPPPLRAQPQLQADASRPPGCAAAGSSPDRRLVEFIELADHPFWVGTQAHPEFKSRPDRPHPLFRELVVRRPGRAARRRSPQLFVVDETTLASCLRVA